MELLQVQNVKKIYNLKRRMQQCVALRQVSFDVGEGEFLAIMGPSGSGKTTLLNIIASLDRPTEGDILLDGRPFSGIRERELSEFRRKHLGFVFQDFNLLDNFSLKDNILLPLVLSNTPLVEMERQVALWRDVHIEPLLNKYPYRCRAARSSAPRWHGPLLRIPDSYWRMNRPARSTPRPPPIFLAYSAR
jgi:putative ABC transport system ATP-binding protein